MTYKLPEEWKEVKIGDVVDSVSNRMDEDKRKVIPINTSDIYNGKVLNHKYKYIEDLPGQFKKTFKKHDILFSEIRPVNLRHAYINFESNDYIASTKLMVLRVREKTLLPLFFYRYITSWNSLNYLQLLAETRSGTFPQIRFAELKNMNIYLPPLKEQESIVSTLSALDDKIENNNKIVKNLEKQAQAIFKHWFVDFEFPNEEGKPYKSSGGEMVESELGMIPKGWEIKMIKDFLPVITGKKNANIASKNGKYRFFTCSQKYSFTDNYSFEGKAVLVAGNGDFNVKFYNGKFEAYQRTYVLIPYNKDFAAFIYYMVKHNLDKIIMNARGSVISYLTKSDIENSSIARDLENNSINEIVKFFNLINNKILYLQEENQKLEELRDTLLPKLISGELRIPLD